jgi:hypothetical protein
MHNKAKAGRHSESWAPQRKLGAKKQSWAPKAKAGRQQAKQMGVGCKANSVQFGGGESGVRVHGALRAEEEGAILDVVFLGGVNGVVVFFGVRIAVRIGCCLFSRGDIKGARGAHERHIALQPRGR